MPNPLSRGPAARTLRFLLNSERRMRMLQWTWARARGAVMAGVENDTMHIPRRNDGGAIRTRVYKPQNASADLPILVYYHGGGYAIGLPEQYHPRVRAFMAARPCIVVVPEYRRSLDAPYPAGHDDCFDALLWAWENAARLGGRSDQIIIGGDSAGGGLTLSTAIRARDDGRVKIAFQMPIYGMIEDREEGATILPAGDTLWTNHHNRLSWGLLLRGHQSVPDLAAPARVVDVSGLPPVLNFIGDQDVFLNENRVMMDRIAAAGVPVTFRVFPDLFHGQEFLFPDLPLSQSVNDYLYGGFASMVDQYFGPEAAKPETAE